MEENLLTNYSPTIDCQMVDIYSEGFESLYLTCGTQPSGCVKEIRNGIRVTIDASNEDIQG